jgi:hypothetical protein
MRRVVPAGEDPQHRQDHQPEDEPPDGSPPLAPGLPPDGGADYDQDQDDAHVLIVAAAGGACKPPRARDRFRAFPKDAAKAERVAMSCLRDGLRCVQSVCIFVRLQAVVLSGWSTVVVWDGTGGNLVVMPALLSGFREWSSGVSAWADCRA